MLDNTMNLEYNGISPEEEDAIKKQVGENLTAFLQQNNITQKQLSTIIGSSEPCISDYKKGKKLPPIKFLLDLSHAFGISIDDILFKKITPADYDDVSPLNKIEEAEIKDYQKFTGTYYTYYFDTSSYKGRDSKNPPEALMYGILHIYKTPSQVEKLAYSCIAILGFSTREEVIQIKKEIDGLPASKEHVEEFARKKYYDKTYYGDLELTRNHAFLSLSHANKDRALIILHRPTSNNSKYSGGIGTINSASRGRESAPVIQFIGISRNNVSLSEEELHRLLLLSQPDISAKKEASELFSTFNKLYGDENEMYESFTELQKKITLQADLERCIRKSMENNMFRCAKISNLDDDFFYHGLKEAFLSD